MGSLLESNYLTKVDHKREYLFIDYFVYQLNRIIMKNYTASPDFLL